MTIKEIEALSGMTRANIRFYEAEGLLSPERGTNGYRNYSQEDLETLLRVRLLRSLRMPLEEIRRVHTGTSTLEAALLRHLTTLDQEQESIERSRRVCLEMTAHHDEYRTLDAQRYLTSLASTPASVPAADVLPPVYSPWRRWFARGLDMTLYSCAWSIFLMLACNINVSQRSALGNLLDAVVPLILMLVIEPVLLHFFGTTPGKWILGLSVTDPDGGRLTVSAARERTWAVLWSGMGLTLPVYQLVREWKSYQACASGEPLPWESDSVLVLRDTRRWRYAALAGGYAVALALLTLALAASNSPLHRGDITAAQFSANFNRLAAYHGADFGGQVCENGSWLMDPDTPGSFVIHIGGKVEQPAFSFTESDGMLTAVSFRYETTDPTIWPPSFQDQMTLTALSFACTENGFGLFSGARAAMLKAIAENEYRSFQHEDGGISIVCEVHYDGYEHAGFLWPEEGAETHFALSFTVTKDK